VGGLKKTKEENAIFELERTEQQGPARGKDRSRRVKSLEKNVALKGENQSRGVRSRYGGR